MHDLALKLAAICAAGIFAQWVAWRYQLPAIVLLLAAGFLMGPVTEFVNPVQDFGDVFRPVVGLAVAIVMFEGGLTLNFKEIAGTPRAVRRVIFFGGPLVWLGGALAAHYAGGLDWPVAAVLGAVFVVTGPTVVMPLLRTAKLRSRPASVLRWEAIVNDAIGALFAVFAFEAYLVITGGYQANYLLRQFVIALLFAVAGGYGVGRLIIGAFIRGRVPDYLKAPVLIAAVLLMFSVSNLFLEESGLLTVTIMGITLANSRISSLNEMRRFKETVTVLLVSGLFILLTAALDWETLSVLDWNAAGFVFLLLFVVRPLSIWLVTTGTELSWQERLLIGWIAPRGIVAVAITGLFGTALVEMGVADGSKMIAYTFAVVVASILLHGFSLLPLSQMLGLRSTQKPGLLIAGGSRWATGLARRLTDLNVPVMIADANWNHIQDARLADIPVHYGEVLSEHAHHHIDFNRFGYLLAATDNDAYNALVCTDFGPEIGRSNVYVVGDFSSKSERQSLNFTLGGIALFKDPGIEFRELQNRMRADWSFQTTRLTEEFTYEKFQSDRPEGARIVLWVKPNGSLVFASNSKKTNPQKGDVILSFTPQRVKTEQPEKADVTEPGLPA